MKVLIIDDEANNRNLIKGLLANYQHVSEIEIASSAIEGISKLKTFSPDVIFLDIEMPGGSGFHFLEAADLKFKVVFVTAHEKYAIEALRVKAYDYLLKPVDVKDFDRIMNNLQNESQAQKDANISGRIVVNTHEETYFLKLKNITKVTSAGNYCIYHTANGKEIVASYVLKKACESLPEDNFFRVHNSAVVNLNFVEKIDKTEGMSVVMKDGSFVPISRRKKDEFISLLSQVD